VMSHVANGIRPSRPQFPDVGYDVLTDLWDLIVKCWKERPTERPTGDRIVEAFSQTLGDARSVGRTNSLDSVSTAVASVSAYYGEASCYKSEQATGDDDKSKVKRVRAIQLIPFSLLTAFFRNMIWTLQKQ
jgi:hypothetical protein